MEKHSKVYVAGHTGLVGSAIVRTLQRYEHLNLVCRTRKELDLINQAATNDFFERERPDYVFLAAARVGGILANDTYPASFVYDNTAIQTNVIHAAHRWGVRRLLFLGSSCMYPRDCPQPIKEDSFLTGPLEKTNRPYAIAKINGVEMCWSFNRQYGTKFLVAMPTNLYGPGDNYNPTGSHVVAALIRKFSEALATGATRVDIWGSGTPTREFLHSDDLGEACVFLMNLPTDAFEKLLAVDVPPIINVGTGKEISIADLAHLIADTAGFKGRLKFDSTKPDGTPRKVMDVSRIHALGWQHSIPLRDGIESALSEYAAANRAI